ncbi:MAG: hypothetical protein L7S46_03935 [Candidatus Poseidoniaceae archaeon]|nr:hypothetical protein [Candidatus Poseidoniaceae archaeon]
MVEERPLLTMVKSRMIGEPHPVLSAADEGLLNTLSSLCSFMNAKDLASFLFSPMFTSLTSDREAFVVFEVGLFLDHTKTIDVVGSKDGLVFADAQASGAFSNNVHSVADEEDAVQKLMVWHGMVYTTESRFS